MKRFIQKLALLGTALCLCVSMLVPSAFAAENTTKYVLSFRPGAYGTFSSAAVDYLSKFGEVQTSAAGNLYLQVDAGTEFGEDIESNLRQYIQPNDGYYYRSGLATGTSATEDATYVVEYGVLKAGGVAYTVRYVDATSGTEVAESYTGYANAGDTVTYQAKNIDGYTVDQASQSLTIASGVDMTIEFRYTAVTVPGETITQTTTVVVPGTVATTTGGGTGTGTGTGTATTTTDGTATTDGAAAADGETIADNETPEAAGNNDNQTSNGGESIPDESTPQTDGVTDGDSTSSSNTVATVTVVVLCVALAVAAVAYFLVRRKS